jgi:6-pyruvoyltetrahydropterin/6-carboxytetrahydropterin synthase
VSFTEIEKTFGFESAHRLPHVPEGHKCARLHGHSFRVTLRVRGPVDARTGWICDFADLDAAWRPLHALLDHRFLNEVEGLGNPTSELIAAWIAERLVVPAPARLWSVTVHETCNTGCTLHVEG